jgi:hypothetical protein
LLQPPVAHVEELRQGGRRRGDLTIEALLVGIG